MTFGTPVIQDQTIKMVKGSNSSQWSKKSNSTVNKSKTMICDENILEVLP